MSAGVEQSPAASMDAGVGKVFKRLEERQRAITDKYEALVEKYGSARSMAGEVQALVEAYEGGKAALMEVSLEGLSREVEQHIEEKGWAEIKRFSCRFRQGVVAGPEGEERLDLEALAEEWMPMGEVVTDQGEGVTYPIIFSHQEGDNLRAAQLEVMWLALIRWARRRLQEAQAGEEMVFEDGERQVVVSRDGQQVGPGPEELGWREEGEIDGRLERFVERDPRAHWRWVEEKRCVGDEQRFRMRDHRGAVVEIHCQPGWRRLKIRWREATEVFRHRRDVFAEAGSWRREDWVAADEEGLEGIWRRKAEEWIDEGYRLVEVEQAE